MVTTLEMNPMAKQSDPPKRNDAPAKIDVGVLAKAKIAAAYRGVSLAEYLSEALRPIVERDIEEGHSRLSRPKPKGTK